MTRVNSKSEQLSSSQKILLALKEARHKLESIERAQTEPIAIIGLGTRFPGGIKNPQDFWEFLQAGKSGITNIPKERWNIEDYYDPNPETPGKMYIRQGGFLSEIDQFEPQFFGISPREAHRLDPQQRLLLEVSWEALENAGIAPSTLKNSNTGVFIGIGQNDYSQLQFSAGDVKKISEYDGSGNGFCFSPGRISYILGLQGPAMAIDTACSSSLVALHLACQSLRNKECNLALVGGVQLILSPRVSIFLAKTHALSPDGLCKSFDDSADGFGRGEGCGVIILKRLSEALADEDNILALVRGSAVNHDGPSSGLTVPNGLAQQAVIRKALANAKVQPSQVSYVEAHGTGTALGDPIEVRALEKIFAPRRGLENPLYIGSVKTNIGHLEAAAGIAGVIKTLLALQNREIPAHLHFNRPNHRIDWDSIPIQVPKEKINWTTELASRFAGVSSFGMSGTNAHIILEEAPQVKTIKPEVERPLHLLTLSAKTESALRDLACQYQNYLNDYPKNALENICFTSNCGREHFSTRLGIVASSTSELQEKLNCVSLGKEVTGLVQGQLKANNSPKIAFLFTGQGSQYLGMARQLYETQPSFRATLDYCQEVLSNYLDQPLLSVLYPPPGETTPIDETAYTQPALFAIEYALAQLWQSWGIIPSVVMGHSVGEYVAACVAGVFSLEDGLKLIAHRGRLMHSLPSEGKMVAVRADESQLQPLLQAHAQQISLAAINGPENLVISGLGAVVDALGAQLQAQGIKTKDLKVSQGFHSPLMEPMLAEFAKIAQEIRYAQPKIDLVSNLTGKLATEKIATSSYWVEHIRACVQFAEGMKTLQEQGVRILVEIGPKPVLLGMGAQYLPEAMEASVPSLRPAQEDWQVMLRGLAELYVRGVKVNWRNFEQDYPRRRLSSLPTYPFQRSRYWLDTVNAEEQIVDRSVSASIQISPVQLSSPGKVEKQLEQNLQQLRALIQQQSELLSAIQNKSLATDQLVQPVEKYCRFERSELLQANLAERQQKLESYLREKVALVLGFAPNELKVDIPLTYLGIDSLMAQQLKNRLEQDLQIKIPETKLLEGPSIIQLIPSILEQIFSPSESVLPQTETNGHALNSPPEENNGSSANAVLSSSQERMWRLSQIAPDNPLYNFQLATRLTGHLQINILQQALKEMVRRHESLRTIFTVVDAEPVQQVLPKMSISVPMIDLSRLTAEEQGKEIQTIATQDVHQPFDLAQGPLFRTTLIDLGKTEQILILTMHHIISDYWSMAVFMKEIAQFYESLSSQKPCLLPPLTIQYRYFAQQQRQELQGEIFENNLNYWRHQLSDAPALLDLPTDKPRPLLSSYKGATEFFRLSPDLCQALRQFSRQHGVTLFMTLMAGFKTLLYGYTQQTDLIVGTPTSGRTQTDTEALIGMFSYPMVLRTDLGGNPTFIEVLHRIQSTTLEAYAHKNVPFDKVVEVAQTSGKTGYPPLVQVMFSFIGMAMHTQKIGDLELTPVEIERGMTDFDLFLTVSEEKGTLRGIWEYNCDLFESATIKRMVQHFQSVLEMALSQPEQSISDFVTRLKMPQRIPVVIASSFTAEPIQDSLKFWMQELKMQAKIEFAPYNQIFQQLLDPNSLLNQNHHGVNSILVRLEDWLRYESQAESQIQVKGEEKLKSYVEDFIAAMRSAKANSQIPYLVCLCPGKPDSETPSIGSQLWQKLENHISIELESLSGVYVTSSEQLLNKYPVANYYDRNGDQLGHVPFTEQFFTALGTLIARQIRSLKSSSYKVIVADCDQTLWTGICGEDGVNGLKIDPVRQNLQSFLLNQKNSGMLICLCSKNNEADVIEVFQNRSDMLLKREDIVTWRVNWQPKSENIKSLAEELKLGLEHFIFIDDSPLECAEVQANCPEVLTLQLPENPESIPQFLENIWAFDRLHTTETDKQRTLMYQQNLERERLQSKSLTFSDFITSLNIKIQISEMSDHSLPRVSQLTQRTNQFNATTIRRSEVEIKHLCEQDSYECLVVEVKDRFGDYGLVGVMLFKDTSKALEVDTFLLSCRALGRGVEYQMLAHLGKIAQQRQKELVNLSYVPTQKNQPILAFLKNVAEPFTKEQDQGICFQIPASVAQSISYSPSQADSLKETSTSNLPTPTVSATPKRNSLTLFTRIATELSNVEQILEVIQASQLQTQAKSNTPYVAPQTEIEKTLAKIWKDLLRVEKVGVNDNFFDLGGHSLLAVQLMSKLREVFAEDLPITTIFQYPTISSMANSLCSAQSTDNQQILRQSKHRGSKRRQLLRQAQLLSQVAG
jgi:FkbH-like protein